MDKYKIVSIHKRDHHWHPFFIKNPLIGLVGEVKDPYILNDDIVGYTSCEFFPDQPNPNVPKHIVFNYVKLKKVK